MLQRAASLLIIVFWLTMTTMLVRNEVAPDRSRMREVPVGHVLKLLFLPERGSELNITSDGALVGRLNLRPRVDPITEMQVLDFDSALQVRGGTKDRQRVKLEGSLQLDQAMTMQQFNFALSLFDATPVRTEVEIKPADNRAHVAFSSQAHSGAPWLLIDERDYTLDQAGARELLGQMGVDPSLLTTTSAPRLAPTVRARLSSMLLHGEHVETYLLTIEQSGQTLLELHISQLGNVLQAKTILGYKFAPDDVTP